MTSHTPVPMVRSPEPIHTQYVYRGWKALFICPTCARRVWQHLNFLGRRAVVCSGHKITKEAK